MYKEVYYSVIHYDPGKEDTTYPQTGEWLRRYW